MGKYMMKKSKAVRAVMVVEGVRTRAKSKTLALQRLMNHVGGDVDESSWCYLQLRSRRLEKCPPPPPPPTPSKQQQQQQQQKDKASCREGDRRKQNQKKGSDSLKVVVVVEENNSATSNEVALEGSFADNIWGFEPRDSSTRESTPCSLIRGHDTIGTPGSTTKQASSTATNQGVRSDGQRIMPTAHEIEEFFTCAEKQQHRLFIEKYNFDIVNDLPLPGRYEWVQVVP